MAQLHAWGWKSLKTKSWNLQTDAIENTDHFELMFTKWRYPVALKSKLPREIKVVLDNEKK